ncbi:GNAT family N-acetyltransferase [Streptomyces sp. NPDC057638]|uniref:GNAT family N-acetyltransferase n=1 Tax=Streptomyces sp. NPDC057638 TaxID=3346190 RepID=UPI0036B57A66
MSTDSPTRPRTVVHEQTVNGSDGFGTVRIVPLDPVADLDTVYSWVSVEHSRYWGMLDHTREQVGESYAYLDSLTTHHAFLVTHDGEPAALLETYEPGADPIGECYPVQRGDVGMHLLVGPAPEGGARPGYTGALFGVLIDYLFTSPDHSRIVLEPDVRNERMLRRLVRMGFTLGPEVDKPEKRARLAFLRRPGSARSS